MYHNNINYILSLERYTVSCTSYLKGITNAILGLAYYELLKGFQLKVISPRQGIYKLQTIIKP